MKRVVLDASALMTFFEDRPGARMVEDLIKRAIEGKIELLMSVINWGEVYYSTWRMRGQATAKAVMDRIAQLPIEVIAADIDSTRLAAELKAQHKMPYADSFAAALAQTRDAAVATCDAGFTSLEKQLAFVWIR
ncbi:MAG: type II toxin-antitoxin system VapC family toxin [Candidatus Acidiferrales bacterium]